jgi:hypothetical protein
MRKRHNRRGASESSGRRLVQVEWIHSHSGDGWQPIDEIAAASHRHRRLDRAQRGQAQQLAELARELVNEGADLGVEVLGGHRGIGAHHGVTKQGPQESTPASILCLLL